MIRAFISQPMNGLTDKEISARRNDAEEALADMYKNQDVQILDTFFMKAPHDANPLWFLGKAIQMMADADVAYFVQGWSDARGCRIEHECAVQYGIKIIEE